MIYHDISIVNPIINPPPFPIAHRQVPRSAPTHRGPERGALGFIVHRQTSIRRTGAAQQLAVHVEVLGPVLEELGRVDPRACQGEKNRNLGFEGEKHWENVDDMMFGSKMLVEKLGGSH